jgi:predicted nucleic acid-binding protein
MIVVDSSIWIDHIRAGEPLLEPYLLSEQALMHPHALGEIALGAIPDRHRTLSRFLALPAPKVARDGFVLHLIERHELWGLGIGYTDAHLLASALLTPGGRLWTRDKRLHDQAERLGVAFIP